MNNKKHPQTGNVTQIQRSKLEMLRKSSVTNLEMFIFTFYFWGSQFNVKLLLHPNLNVICTVNVQYISSSVLFILLNPR